MKLIETVVWDWNNALGDTIMEKYESLYICLHEQSKKLSPDNGPECLICNTVIGSIFEAATSGFRQADAPLTVNGILEYKGCLNARWFLWYDYFMHHEEIWVCNNTEMVKVHIVNLII